MVYGAHVISVTHRVWNIHLVNPRVYYGKRSSNVLNLFHREQTAMDVT